MSKKKRYNGEAGSSVELPDYEREPDEQDRKQQEGALAEYKDRKEKEEILSKPLAKASFKEAFADARSAGDKTFEYMGKKYTTELASEKPKTVVTKTEKQVIQKTPQQELEDWKQGKGPNPALKRDAEKERQLIDAMGGGSGTLLRGLAKAGSALANRIKSASNLRFADTVNRLPAPEVVKRLPAPPKQLGMKKGGAVKKMASGGKVSSASRRGDGIATKGKTRGRIV